MSAIRLVSSRRSTPASAGSAAARRATRCATAIFCGLLVGCAHAPLNAPLARYEPEGGYRSRRQFDQVQDHPLSMVLFFSGGGTRAAALSFGVLQELARTALPDGTRMLDRVEAISAVSGGSFPAAYYCLYGDRLFTDFEKAFLKRDVQDAVLRRYLSLRLASSYFARSDLAAEYYDRILFHGATFGDLLHASSPRPFLIINATDMDSFVQFPFLQETFDLIGSDLSSYPIARAVAASSAVPFILSPITLKNYAGRLPPPDSPALRPVEPNATPANRRQQDLADLARSYLDAQNRPYIHLLDGGLTDNLGLSNLVAEIALAGGWDALLPRGVHGKVPQVAIIVVNAATNYEAEWAREQKTPSIRHVVSALSKSAINRNSAMMLELVRESLDEWQRHAAPGEVRPQVHLINVDFAHLDDPAERDYFNRIPTSFRLPPETVDRLEAVGGRILREAPEFRALQAALTRASSPPPSAGR